MEFDEKGMWYLIHNEDRMSLKKLSKIFHCTPQEVYAYYDEITRTDIYLDYIYKRAQAARNSNWLERLEKGRNEYQKKISNQRESNEDVETDSSGLHGAPGAAIDDHSVSGIVLQNGE